VPAKRTRERARVDTGARTSKIAPHEIGAQSCALLKVGARWLTARHLKRGTHSRHERPEDDQRQKTSDENLGQRETCLPIVDTART
jgi:hypothetical protein